MISVAVFRFGKLVEVLLDVRDFERALLEGVFPNQIVHEGDCMTGTSGNSGTGWSEVPRFRVPGVQLNERQEPKSGEPTEPRNPGTRSALVPDRYRHRPVEARGGHKARIGTGVVILLSRFLS